MPIPSMTFWQAMSAFREHGSVLGEVFRADAWRDRFGAHYARFDDLVRVQNRAILDGELPTELTRDIAARCTRLRFTLSDDGWLRRSTSELSGDGKTTMLSALDVHDRYGGLIIEEVLEYGSARITHRNA